MQDVGASFPPAFSFPTLPAGAPRTTSTLACPLGVQPPTAGPTLRRALSWIECSVTLKFLITFE